MADTENRRDVDRIRAITFKEAKNEGANFITKAWVAERLLKGFTFVQDNWNKDPYNCEMEKDRIGKSGMVLNEHEKRTMRLCAGFSGNNCRKVAKRLAARRVNGDNKPSFMTVYRY